MGHRRKLLYTSGFLYDALTGELLRHWADPIEEWEPEEYRLTLESRGLGATLWEDEEALWLMDHSSLLRLSAAPVSLPRFEGHPQAALLRRLHHELLVNLVPIGPSGAHGPVPNLLVYRQPWYRDAAMVLMVLAETGNLGLVADWVRGLTEPFDRNNAGHAEPDNLGQLLYMIGLVSESRGTPDTETASGLTVGPLIPVILQKAERCRRGNHLVGLTDGAEHPVYQTKWLKYGLRALGLADDWEIPQVYDPYSALFWMDYRDQHVPGPPFSQQAADRYPYLTWAEAHFHALALDVCRAGTCAPPRLPSCRAGTCAPPSRCAPPTCAPPQSLDPHQFPLTWEAHASEADYAGMRLAGPEYEAERLCVPHTWHAAEMWLYLWFGL
jgi:hypothetical protein